jgi:two-component system OmpR family response regulator
MQPEGRLDRLGSFLERPVRVLLVEDDVALSEAVCGYLQAKAFVVDPVASLAQAATALHAAQYAAVLLDLHLGDGDGLSLLPQIRALKDRPIVIVLTARDQVTDRIRGLDAGADDYLIKPYDPGELLARLRAVERRRSAANAPVLELGDLQVDLARELVRSHGAPVMLTQKEWALLRVMATRPDRIHTRENLQDALYGFDDEADSNTLEVFISRLRRKLGRGHIQTLRGLGYRLVHAAGDAE